MTSFDLENCIKQNAYAFACHFDAGEIFLYRILSRRVNPYPPQADRNEKVGRNKIKSPTRNWLGFSKYGTYRILSRCISGLLHFETVAKSTSSIFERI